MITIRRFKAKDVSRGLLNVLSDLTKTGVIDKRRLKLIIKRINNRFYNIFIAEADGKIVGTATLLIEQKFIHQGSSVAHIEDVAVKGNQQGRGIGLLLMKKLIKEAKRNKCYKIILDFNKGVAGFYKKMGFYVNGYCMRLDL